MKLLYSQKMNQEIKGTIRLYSIILLFILMILFLGKSEAFSFDARINDQITKGQGQEIEGIELNYSGDKKYILAQVEREKDWWEELKVGRIKNENINWLKINKPPSEQAILSGRFINLKDFANPLIEIYGLTHAGHGFLYIYEIQNDELNLLFETPAVDINPDIRWAPDNFKKYGYGNCGEIFFHDKLVSEYKDINKDGISDLILSGTKKIICEIREEYLKNTYEITVSSVQINKIILWNNSEHTWTDVTDEAPKK